MKIRIYLLPREYVKFELLYVEKLKARQNLLKGQPGQGEEEDKQKAGLDSVFPNPLITCLFPTNSPMSAFLTNKISTKWFRKKVKDFVNTDT